jgi:hypothetical protein
MKKLALLIWVSLLFGGIFTLFWYKDFQYSLPTPLPPDYKAVNTGTSIIFPHDFTVDPQKPVFVHFFNPECPCSRFNITHFKSLVKQYRDQVNFAVVVMNNTKYSKKEIQDRFGINLPVSFDTALATACGVYSTPQAVILDNQHQLYYRGNYNKNRYCTDKKTNYAQMALTKLLNHEPGFLFDQYALTAYGCELPQCTKN